MKDRSAPNPLVVALGLFSTIPMRSVENIDARMAGRAMASFPLVGLLLGVLSGAALWLAGSLGGPLLGAVLGIATLAWVTGALHLDGLADTADGLGSRKPAAQALEVMRRSDIGPMGVIALLFVLLADVAALSHLSTGESLVGALALVGAAILGRVSVVFATTSGHDVARPQGFGALFHGVTHRATAAIWGITTVVLSFLLGWFPHGLYGALAFGTAGVVALGVGWLWREHLARRLGGLTGDTFGSIIEVTQAVFLVGTALVLDALPSR